MLKAIRTQVIDTQLNLVDNIAVGFSADNGAVVEASSVNTDAQGIVETTLLSTMAGISRVSAEVNQQRTMKETVFIGNNASAQVVAVTPASGPYIADGRTPVLFSAKVEDSNGNLLFNVAVDWHSDRDSNQVRFSQR
nr:Ig-like domain-containing protein [Candidatus Symbiopectobacterium sp. 'North America']